MIVSNRAFQERWAQWVDGNFRWYLLDGDSIWKDKFFLWLIDRDFTEFMRGGRFK